MKQQHNSQSYLFFLFKGLNSWIYSWSQNKKANVLHMMLKNATNAVRVMRVKQCEMSVDDICLAPSKPRCRRRRQCRGLCDPRHARSHRRKQQRSGGKKSSRRHAWRPRLAWSPSCPWRHTLNPKPWNPNQRHHANNRGYGDGATNHSVATALNRKGLGIRNKPILHTHNGVNEIPRTLNASWFWWKN